MRADELVLDRQRRLGDLAQLAVDPEAHAVVVLVGLEVQVGGAQVDRVDQHLLQEAHDRRVLDVARAPALVRLAGDVVGDVELEVARGQRLHRLVGAGARSSRGAWRACRARRSPTPATSWVANLMRSAASWSVGSAPPMKSAVAALAEHHDLVLRRELGVDDVASAAWSRRSRSGRAAAARARPTACAQGRTARRRRRAITAATKLERFSRELRTSSSAVLALSLPAWTSTLATPERAECGASARVSNL